MAIADLVSFFRSRFNTYSPVVELLEDETSGDPVNRKATGNAAWTFERGIVGGERNTDSETNNYTVIHEEVNYYLFDPNGTSETVISAAPCFLYGFMGRTGTGTLTLRDAAAATASTSPFPAFTLAVGTGVSIANGKGIRMETGLTAQLGTGTDDCVIFYRPL